MKVLSLEVMNLYCFQHAVLSLDRPLTVLVGPNGAGKSSLLDALAVVLGATAVAVLQRPLVVPALTPTKLRRGEEHAEVGVVLSFGKTPATVRLTADRVEGLAALRTRVEGLPTLSTEERPGACLALYYSSRRHAAPDLRERWKGGAGTEATTPEDALDGALGGGGLGFTDFFRWFRDREDHENAEKVRRAALNHEDPQLRAVRSAVLALLPGFADLRVERAPLRMVVSKDQEELSVEQLSDGEQNLLTLAGDIARRLAIANPAHPSPREAEAVVLLDELELHLHPHWQRRIVGALRTAFPHCQFVVTTHSPQVLSEVPTDSVVLLKDFQLLRPSTPTTGRDSNAILEELLGTPNRPERHRERLRAVSALLDSGRYTEARARVDELARELSEVDHEIVGLRTMLHFLGDADAVAEEES